MKKRKSEDKPRRLTLHRETIQILDERMLLAQVQGGLGPITTSQTWGFEEGSSAC